MRTFVWALLLFTACSSTPPVPNPEPDAGSTVTPQPERDAGTLSLDAGGEDAGLVDAGSEPAADAGPSFWGARLDEQGQRLEVRVQSRRATRVEVLVFDAPMNAPAIATAVMDPAGEGRWSASVPVPARDGGALFYGLRAWGPNWPWVEGFTPGSTTGFRAEVDGEGNRFNPNKLLFDPFALEQSHDPKNERWQDFDVYLGGPAHRAKDSAAKAPKGVVLSAGAADVGPRPIRALKDDVIYEVHVRGLTMNDLTLPEAIRGTYAGAATRARALADLGITAIEFLPVQETQNETNDLEASTSGDNYWGYMTLAYFAPDRRYASDKGPGGPTREFQQMVRAFHEAGLKVFIDVVYNHTGEGGTQSFRGLDNASYYSLTHDRRGSWDNTGTVGNFNTRNPLAQTLIIDSLRYWHEVLGVDGYRFDLSPVLGNTCEHGCFRYSRDDPATALNRIRASLPVRAWQGGPGVDLIAEPWAIGDGTYQMGNHPPQWAEWNDRFRDAVRTHQNRLGFDETSLAELVQRVSGSADLVGDEGRPPAASINFVVAHDGFTLRDLYACNTKNNEQPWPWGPTNGGSDFNRSWDQGGSARAQRAAARKGMALSLLSAGVPMFNGGDEHLRTLRCNNNPYSLDSDRNWLAATLTTEETWFRTFTERLLRFRATHPSLRPAQAWRSGDGNSNGLEQVRWFQPSGAVADAAYLANRGNHALALRLDDTEFGGTDTVLVAINGWTGPLQFALPWAGAGKTWRRVGDTCEEREGPEQLARSGDEVLVTGPTFWVCGRGLVLLVGR
ncbi:MAG: glycogen-debranching protein [Myxococcaceae bacterium]|nr:glycogen-debranching protein [Myxococcaceae bacterium]